jgi:RNA polymerase primary sigma factor
MQNMAKKMSIQPVPRTGRPHVAPYARKIKRARKAAVRAEVAPPPPATDVAAEEAPESVAMMEAVAALDESEPAPRPTTSEPASYLGMYFRDMARLGVLRPQEEFEAARRIEELELGLWVRLLTHAPAVDAALKIVERMLENSLADFRGLRRAAEAAAKPRAPKASHEKLAKLVRKLAPKLRVLDVDRHVTEALVTELLASTPPKENRTWLREVARDYHRAQRAKNEFVKANLRLVVSIARRFNFGRMPLADLIQEGNIGLIKAVERYEWRRGYRFSTYASWWIRHAISRALADKGRAVRLPVHMIDAYHRLSKAKRELSAALGRNATTEELAKKSGIPAPKIEKMRTFLLDQPVSLDRPVSDEDGRKFIDFVQDPEAEISDAAETLVDEAMTNEVRAQLQHLKPIEADILRQRFGLDSDEELTLKEIGEKYNLSRERIRQLQEQALAKMRRALQRKDLM